MVHQGWTVRKVARTRGGGEAQGVAEISVSGFTFTADDWGALDEESRQILAGDDEYAGYELWVTVEVTPPPS